MSNFDYRLSLDIDACHVILDGLRGQHGIAATLTRWWWQRRLHRLERRVRYD